MLNDTKHRKRAARIICLLLAVCLLGCKSADDDRDDAAVPEDVVLSAFVQQAVSADSGIWKGWAANRLYEETHIKVDFYPTGVEVEEKLKQYTAAGTLPDIIGFRDKDQAQMMIDAGLLLPLDDYQKLLPAIFQTKEYENAVTYSREYNSNNEDRLYIMPTSIGKASDNAYNWMPMLQWDAYKKAGSPPLATLEDYLEVVEQMVKAKPVNKYGKKVYGFSLFTDWDKYSALEIAALSYFYGIDTEYVSPLMETNVITRETNSILADNSFYRRALHFYFAANQRGLLDPDSRMQSYRNIQNKFDEGRIMFSWFSWLTGTYNGISKGNVNNPYQPDGYVNILADDMKIYEAPDQTIGRNWYFAISRNSKSVEKACTFLNWFYDLKTQHYLYNGPEGCLWQYNEKGEPQVTDEGWKVIDNHTEDIMPLPEGGAFDNGVDRFNALGLQAGAVMGDGYPISYRYWPGSLKNNDTLVQKEVREMLGTDSVAEYLHNHDMAVKSTMAVNMVSTVPDEIKGKIAVIGEIIRKYSWNMVYAQDEAEFEEQWQNMTKEARELGMDEVERHYQKAWQEALQEAAEYE